MIADSDARFHSPTTDDPAADTALWAETNYFGLYAGQDTERPVNIGLYALFRKEMGMVGTTVSINSRRVREPWAAEYWDAQNLPAAAELTDYRLANGLQVVCRDPNRVWDVDYSDPAAGVEVHFRYTAIMPAYDINDPEQDPLAVDRDMAKTWGHAYAGHFDQSGRYEGEVSVRGRTLPIDCVATMDHSWGVRAERQTSRLSWMHAHFGEDLVVHGLFDFDTKNGPDGESALRLTHGYLVEDGQTHGLDGGHGVTRRRGLYPETISIEVSAGSRTVAVTGQGLTTFPWQSQPGVVGHNVLLRWEAEGRTGFGECMDFVGLGELGEVWHRELERP